MLTGEDDVWNSFSTTYLPPVPGGGGGGGGGGGIKGIVGILYQLHLLIIWLAMKLTNYKHDSYSQESPFVEQLSPISGHSGGHSSSSRVDVLLINLVFGYLLMLLIFLSLCLYSGGHSSTVGVVPNNLLILLLSVQCYLCVYKP